MYCGCFIYSLPTEVNAVEIISTLIASTTSTFKSMCRKESFFHQQFVEVANQINLQLILSSFL